MAVLINRSGQVVTVAVGDRDSLMLPPTKKREAVSRLSGLRCVHIHPMGGGLNRGDLVTLAMHRFDLMAAIETEGGDLRNAQLWLANLAPVADEEGNLWRLQEPQSVYQGEKFDFETWISELEREFGEQAGGVKVETEEKAIIVSLVSSSADENALPYRLEELKQLVKTAGAEVLDQLVQRRDKPEPAIFIGKGKAEELALLLRERGATMAVFDAELSPSQQRNLEEILGVKVLDRPGIILDIFAQRAQTSEGKLQVELAQLNYLLPRLSGRGTALSRLGGGIGTRGPGETKLEVDRRRIRTRIARLSEDIERIKEQRQAQRKSRAKQGAIVVALVGYTNSGKSTLLNALTNADVLAENKLFATLDP
ncbi:MAG TPA: GTPase HflX, partial [Chroococcales cyanobacterium]